MKLRLSIFALAFLVVASCSKTETPSPEPEPPTPPVTPPPPAAVTYYVSNAGDDNNDGKSASTPWKTIAKVNSVNLLPGESVLFKGGETFQGNLDISRKSGTANARVTIGSYGGSRAILDAGATGSAIIARNTQYITVRDLVVRGAGYKVNTANGIFFYTDTSVIMKSIAIANVDVSGFMGRGLFLNVPWPLEKVHPGGQKPPAGSKAAGYEGVRIDSVEAHDNGMAGIEVNGYWDYTTYTINYISHKDIQVRYCRAHDNKGVINYPDMHSGSGILIASAYDVKVEYCVAYENGSENGARWMGPVGIWLAEVRNGLIQYSESYRNRRGRGNDGGGFVVDGGTTNCVIQYCYSHDNTGAGYGIFEWGSGNSMSNITVRHNISENDGHEMNYAGICLWAMHNITDIFVHNNTIYLKDKDLATGGSMTAVRMWPEQFMTNLKVFNNVFIADGPNTSILGGSIGTGEWKNNVYWTMNGATSSGFNYGTFADPMLTAPGAGGDAHPFTAPNPTKSFLAYTPLRGSPVVDAGITLGILMAQYDFNGSRIPLNGTYDVGSIEFK
jgi:hypothetical protein